MRSLLSLLRKEFNATRHLPNEKIDSIIERVLQFETAIAEVGVAFVV